MSSYELPSVCFKMKTTSSKLLKPNQNVYHGSKKLTKYVINHCVTELLA